MSLYDYSPEELEKLLDIVDEIAEGIREPGSVFDGPVEVDDFILNDEYGCGTCVFLDCDDDVKNPCDSCIHWDEDGYLEYRNYERG